MPKELIDAEGFVFDMDGTLVLGDKASAGQKALPGAVETLELLRERGVPYQIFTNGTARTPEWYANAMWATGLDVRDEEFMTPSTAAAHYLKDKGAGRILVLGREPVWKPLADLGLDVVESPVTAALMTRSMWAGSANSPFRIWKRRRMRYGPARS